MEKRSWCEGREFVLEETTFPPNGENVAGVYHAAEGSGQKLPDTGKACRPEEPVVRSLQELGGQGGGGGIAWSIRGLGCRGQEFELDPKAMGPRSYDRAPFGRYHSFQRKALKTCPWLLTPQVPAPKHWRLWEITHTWEALRL